MRKVLDHLPNWTFVLGEVSAGVYQVMAMHMADCSIVAEGTEVSKLIERATADNQKIGSDVERKNRL